MGGHSALPHSLSGFGSVRHVPVWRMRIEHIHAFGAGFVQDAQNRGVPPDVPVAGAVAGGVQVLGDLSLAPALQKQFVGFAADGGFLRLDDQFAVFPLVAIRGTCH